MDPILFPAFIDESLRSVPAIRASLARFAQNGRNADDLSEALDIVRTILSSSRMLGLAEIEHFAAALEAEISGLTSGGMYDHRAASASDLLSKLEATLLSASMEEDNSLLDIDLLFDEPFPVFEDAVLFPEPAAPPIPVVVDEVSHAEPVHFESSSPDDEFEIDPELLEIFAEEAEELLRNIESSLDALAADPNDSDSLWEIRRDAHTFKGSAGIVGLKQLSELAHRIEDMLDRLAETKNSSNERIFAVLHRSTTCLKALVKGDNSQELFASISQLYFDFDGVVAALNDPTEIVSEVPAPAVETVYEQLPAVSLLDTLPFEPSVRLTDIIERIMPPAYQPAHHKPAQTRSVVRVSLGRLDELVRIVRDMIISRSTFEQNLKNLERQIDDLHNTTRRLQSTSSKLEIDFEASMMGSGSQILGSGAGSGRHLKPDGFDDLEFDQYTDFHQSTRELAETASDAFSINSSLDTLRGGFESLLDEQHRLVDDLQEKLMRIRMVEFGTLSTRLQRAVRVTCEEEGKKAQITIENEHLEIDTQILDSLIEPLMHLLKNAVVHGIENVETRRRIGKPDLGNIEVSVRNEETHIVLRVADDGGGISTGTLKEKAVRTGLLSSETADEMSEEEGFDLIFLAGLTTAEKLNLSAGRGVGMNIVKESISAARGTITIESTLEKGTTFTIRMPLALAIANVLLVKSANGLYALPTKQITYIAELSDDMFAGIDGQKVEVLGKKQPLVQLSTFLGQEPLPPAALLGKPSILYNSAGQSCMIAVDDILSSEEVVIKPLARPLDRIPGFLGAAILGNGQLVPIIDLPSMIRKKARRPRNAVRPTAIVDAPSTISVLIVDDSPSVRHLTSKVIQSAGWTSKTAKDGIDALEQLKATEVLPDVILSDIEMPRMDGFELAASLQRSESFRAIPVIVITSRTAEKHRDKAMENGVSHYLTKPYDDKELIETVRRLAKSI